MDREIRVLLFVVLISAGVILGLAFLNVLEINLKTVPLLFSALAAGIALVMHETEFKAEHGILAILAGFGIVSLAYGRLAVATETILASVALIAMILPKALADVREKFIAKEHTAE